MYKVKSMFDEDGVQLQRLVSTWIETTESITVLSVNIWCDNKYHYATIVYREEQYYG